MQRRTLVFIGIVAVAVWAGGIRAQSSDPASDPTTSYPMQHHSGRLVKLLMRSTDLTPDQTAQAQQILSAQSAAAGDMHSQLRQAQSDLTNMLLGPQDVAADALSGQLARVATLKQQLAQHRAATVMAIRGILTPDQLAKAAAANDEMWSHHHHKGACPANPT
jgi:Spy/CpxP family protein refolding chaperone